MELPLALCSSCERRNPVTDRSSAIQINDWLKSNPNIEVISWQATPVGDHNELYITIQYKENNE